MKSTILSAFLASIVNWRLASGEATEKVEETVVTEDESFLGTLDILVLGLAGEKAFLVMATIFDFTFESRIDSIHHAEVFVNPKVRAQKKGTDFGYPRAQTSC
jgi:hypothetical protein